MALHAERQARELEEAPAGFDGDAFLGDNAVQENHPNVDGAFEQAALVRIACLWLHIACSDTALELGVHASTLFRPAFGTA